MTSRLTTSPACIVANEPEIDINLARRLRGSGLPSQPVLEINPQHPLVRRLNREPADPHLAEWAHVLFNQAVLTLGARIEEPAAFVSRLNDLLVTLSGAAEAVPDGTLTRTATLPRTRSLSRRAVCSCCAREAPGRQRPARVLPAEPAVGRRTCRPARRTTGCWWSATWPRRSRTSSGRCGRSPAGSAPWSGCPATTTCGLIRADPVQLRGEDRYQHLVALCRELGVITPEDPYPVWPRRRRARGDRPAVPALRLHVPPGRHQHQGRGAGPGLQDRGRGHRRSGAAPRPVSEPGGVVPGAGSTRPRHGWRPSTPACRPSWSTTFRSPANPPGSCATPSSPSGAAPSRRPTGTCGTAPGPWSTATCTSRGPPGRTACGSRRCRSATPRSRRSTRAARAG